MSMGVYAIRDVEQGEFADKLAALAACKKARVAVPQELRDYVSKVTGGECAWDDTEERVREHAGVYGVSGAPWCMSHAAYAQEGYQVEVAMIPKDVKFIRFVCSW